MSFNLELYLHETEKNIKNSVIERFPFNYSSF